MRRISIHWSRVCMYTDCLIDIIATIHFFLVIERDFKNNFGDCSFFYRLFIFCTVLQLHQMSLRGSTIDDSNISSLERTLHQHRYSRSKAGHKLVACTQRKYWNP